MRVYEAIADALVAEGTSVVFAVTDEVARRVAQRPAFFSNHSFSITFRTHIHAGRGMRLENVAP